MSRPNILLIMTDQHRLSGVGAYGPTPCRTPYLDTLAAECLRWRSFSYSWTAGFPELLFDLESDPHQLRNLAGDPDAAEALTACRDRLDHWMDEFADNAARTAFQQDSRLGK